MQPIVAGALFDFLGWLTTREERLVLSAQDECPPAVEALREWAEMRGLDLSDARVTTWQDDVAARVPEPA